MKRSVLPLIGLAALLLAFALVILLASGRLADGLEPPAFDGWSAPLLSTVSPTPSPTPGWWSSIVTPTAVSTQNFQQEEKP